MTAHVGFGETLSMVKVIQTVGQVWLGGFSPRCLSLSLSVSLLSGSLIGIGALVGCDEKPQIKQYDAPVDQPVPASAKANRPDRANQAGGPAGAGPMANARGGGGKPKVSTPGGTSNLRSEINYDLPDGWHKAKTSSSVRLVSLVVPAGDRQAEVSLTRFAGEVGSMRINVNRWRRQAKLPPVNSVDQLADKTIRKITFDGLPCTMYDIGPATKQPGAKRIVVAAIRDQRSTWFVKFDGPNAVIESQLDAFSKFIQSLKLPLARPNPDRSPRQGQRQPGPQSP